MDVPVEDRVARARAAGREELRLLLYDRSADVLLALLENPALDEDSLLLLLERKDLPVQLLSAVASRRDWMRSYRVKLKVAGHPRTPRLTALPLIKHLYLFDLVNLTLLPSTPAEIRRVAEESIVARIAQIPLGQKLTLARRGSARVSAALLAEGHPLVVPLALDNPMLTEAQLLKVLSRLDLPEIVPASIAVHRKWSCMYNVRMALVRHPLTPLARVLAFLPDLTLGDLQVLTGASSLSPNLREYISGEVTRRIQSSRRRRGMGPPS